MQPVFGTPVWGDPIDISTKSLAAESYRMTLIAWSDSMFSCFW